MCKLLYILGLFLLSINIASAQSSCSCAENFNFVISTVKKNYSGYNYKITQANRTKLDQLTDSLQKVAKKVNSVECFQVLLQWTDFFSDPHLGVYLDTKKPNHIRSFFSDTEKLNFSVSEKELRKYLNSRKLDPIEGLWEDNEGEYQVAIIKKPQAKDNFIGFILKADSIFWLPGQVKLKIKKVKNKYLTEYFRQDHSVNETVISLEDDKWSMKGGYGYWKKIYPSFITNNQSKTLTSEVSGMYTDNPSFTVIDKETTNLTIPSFSLRCKPALDSLIKTNETVILSRKNLIIDVRDNSGGGTPTFEALLPYLYTNPIIIDGNRVLATNENINGHEKALLSPNIPDNIRQELRMELMEMKNHPNTLVSFPDDTLVLAKSTPNPAKVAILINGNTMSAAELFLLRAKQSAKVTVFGEPSLGGIYFLDAIDLTLPCESIVLRYPTSISNYLEKHQSATPRLEPDVDIPDSTKNWVQYVSEYLKHNP